MSADTSPRLKRVALIIAEQGECASWRGIDGEPYHKDCVEYSDGCECCQRAQRILDVLAEDLK